MFTQNKRITKRDKEDFFTQLHCASAGRFGGTGGRVRAPNHSKNSDLGGVTVKSD